MGYGMCARREGKRVNDHTSVTALIPVSTTMFHALTPATLLQNYEQLGGNVRAVNPTGLKGCRKHLKVE